MKVLENQFWSTSICLNILKFFGLLVPGTHSRFSNILLWIYWLFFVLFTDGIFIIIQFGDLIQIWGDIPLMINDLLLLFTNFAFACKIYVFRTRREAVLTIIDEGEQELRDEDRAEGRDIINESSHEAAQQFRLYHFLDMVTLTAWLLSADKHSFPLSAWYPYDAYKSPAFEISYIHQNLGLFLIAIVHVSMDLLITSLMAICRCRLRLLKLSLRTLCRDLELKNLLTAEQEEIVSARLRVCVRRHQAALRSAEEIQACFSEPILVQFTVSMVIICVTAYELAVAVNNESKNIFHIVAMVMYLQGMTLQVYLYCYQGDRLAEESSEIAHAAYQCEWYLSSIKFRRALLLVMVRSRRMSQLTAGGFTTLSLSSFTSIVKASYTFFTVLQQVEEI